MTFPEVPFNTAGTLLLGMTSGLTAKTRQTSGFADYSRAPPPWLQGWHCTCGSPPTHMQAEHRGENSESLRNKNVQFRIQDVYVPAPAQVFAEMHGQDLLRGRVIDLSECGMEGHSFAVVEVAGLVQPVVVPIAKIFADE